jgi:hypothetical protein
MTPDIQDTIIQRIDQFEERINERLVEIEGKVDRNAIDIASAKGGLKVARWLFTAFVSVAGLFGLSHYYKQ